MTVLEMSNEQMADPGCCATNQNKFRIAHLSDLHFSRTCDHEAWTYVQQVLEEHKPDLLVVTGDVVDSPSLFELALVRQELLSVAKRLQCKVLTVPGNHDIAVWGNVAIWPWRGKYRTVFSGQHDVHFSKLCTFTEFHEKPLFRRVVYRIWWGVKLAWLRGSFQLKAPSKATLPVLNTDVAGGRALIASFDSNAKLWLATGRVDHGAIQSLERELERLCRKGEAGWLAPRVALAHHHAVAIPYSSTHESLTAFEPFLTMRNAGTFLQELGKLEFDVLLHGHKHYWNYVRVSFSAPGYEASEMAVIAAGSPTVKQPAAGENSLNLIDIMPNGLIAHRPLFFGQGKTIAGGQQDDQSGTRNLLTLEQVKERAYRKAVKHLQCNCELLERNIKVDASGAADFSIRVRGYQAYGSRITRRVYLRLGVSSGGINPNGVKLDSESARDGHILNCLTGKLPMKRLIAEITLGVESNSDQGHQASFGVQCRATNCFAITAWEASLLPGPDKDEWAAIVVRQPARQMRLIVEVPDSIRDVGHEIRMLCQRPVNYPLLTFNAHGEVEVPSLETDWVTDQDFTNLEKSKLKLSPVKVPGVQGAESGVTRFELVVDRPLVGFRYLICWPVHKPEPICPVETKGQAFELRKALLQTLDVNPPDRLRALRDSMQAAFDDFRKQALLPDFQSPYAGNEVLVVTVFIYNDSTKTLDVLLEAGPSKQLPGRCTSIPINEGVVGHVFKTRKFGMYVLPDLANGVHDGLYVYYDGDKLPDQGQEFSVLVAFPLYLGQYEPLEGTEVEAISAVPPEAMLGVVTIGTNARDSGLLRLTKDSIKAEEMEMLWSMPEHFVRGVVSTLEQLT